LENLVASLRENMDKLINSKMYEKGNQLIYELDVVSRQLRLLKDNVFKLESELREKIRREFEHALRTKITEVDNYKHKFSDYIKVVQSRIEADVA
jgi:hypothetical protein